MSTPAITNQIVPSGQNPYVNQMSFGQLAGRVNGHNLACSYAVVQNKVNNILRQVYDRRGGRWYGLMTKGQIVAPGYYSTGTITATLGSPTVTGTGTAWTSNMVGWSLRQGFISPIYNIIAVDPVHQVLTLEMPWGNPSIVSSGYFLTQYYYSFPNVRFFYSVKNLQLMFRIYTNVPVTLLETWDPSRLQLFYTRVLATMPPDANGNYQVEMWPAPSTQQAFPYLAFINPPVLANDGDPLPPFIRADIIELGAIAEVLLHNPKDNPGYSETLALETAARFRAMFESELEHAMSVDEGLLRQDALNQFEAFPYARMDWQTGNYLGGGGYAAAMSAISADDLNY